MVKAPAYDPEYQPGPELEPSHPLDFDRESPRTPLRKRRPKKMRSKVRLDPKREPPGIDPKVRRRTFPELFEARYAITLIQTQYAAHRPSPAWESWVQDIICPGHLGNADGIVRGDAQASDAKYGLNGRYLITLHPGFNRWGLFELVKHPKFGPAYKLVSLAMGPPGGQQTPVNYKYLPSDLDPKRWGHLRGLVGDYREFNRKDFEIIRDVGDRRNQRKSQIENKLRAPEDAARAEHDRQQKDQDDALIDDVWPWVTRAAGNAIVYGSDPEFAAAHKAERESRLFIEQKNGYRVIAKKDSEYARIRRTDAEVERREEAKRAADRQLAERARDIDRETARTDRLGRIVSVQILERAAEESAREAAAAPAPAREIADLRRRRQGTM